MDFTHDPELSNLAQQVLEDPEEFERWEKLVRAAEAQEGGLNRNSSPQAIASTRETYDRFLARFPLFFGYWKKYADLEFTIAGTEAAEMVYERGVASIGISVDLWANYCSFKTETSHDVDVIRELFERAADSVGLDFLAHPFWDKYIEFEERLEKPEQIFKILERIIHIPMHQYARYFERYRNMASNRPVAELAPEQMIAQLKMEIEREGGAKQKNDADDERELRTRLDSFQLQIFHKTQAETTKRWTYESEVKRPYFHVTELDEPQLINWRKYLDFEEGEGEYTRTKFLYERCLVTAAYYDEFWLRYARWMLAQTDKEDEVRNIYQRASCIYVPISKPEIRLYYAAFEESVGHSTIAADIHEAILLNLPSHLETISSLANLYMRQYGVDSAIQILKKYIADSFECTTQVRGALVSEWARMVWEIKGDAEGARQIWQSQKESFLDCRPFWFRWFMFELRQPTSESLQATNHQRINAVYHDIRHNSQLSPHEIQEISNQYLMYLQERGGKDSMKEFMQLDREIKGPFSVRGGKQAIIEVDGSESTMHKHTGLENGQAGVETGTNNNPIHPTGNVGTKQYPQAGEHALNGQPLLQPAAVQYPA